MLTANRTKSHPAHCGAPREGSALLAGLLRCARCGHKLHVGYRGKNGHAPRYYCLSGNKEQGKPSCLSFGGMRVDHAVAGVVLEACQPMGVEASLQLLAGDRNEAQQKRRALGMALERARFEADRARRQYDAVDPENRLVAAELEARWNKSLSQVSEAEARLESEAQSLTPLDERQRQRLLALGADLQALWNNSAASPELKKRILRTVVNEIMVDVNHQTGNIDLRIHWAGGVHTVLHLHKNQSGRNGSAVDLDVIVLVRELAQGWPDAYIASILNRLGHRTGPGNSWNETRVKNLRLYHKIPVFAKGTERPWLTMQEAAEELHVGVGVVRTMIEHRILPAQQPGKGTPWMIQREDLQNDDAQKYANHARAGKSLPRVTPNQTVMPYL